jgi:hypothetical protein
MRPLLLAAVAFLTLPPALASACNTGITHVSTRCCDPPARWATRHDPRDARIAITRNDGEATLLLTNEVVAVQLSDRALHKVRRKLRDTQDDDDNPLGAVIRTVVYTTVRSLVDHSVEVPLRDIRDVAYRDGQLRITARNGEPLFDDVDVDDCSATHGYAERDARAFVREYQRVRPRMR